MIHLDCTCRTCGHHWIEATKNPDAYLADGWPTCVVCQSGDIDVSVVRVAGG